MKEIKIKNRGFQPGNPGKPKGAQAKTTKETKEALALIVQGEIDQITESLHKIRKEDPAKYLDLLSKLLPYVVPRQSELDLKASERIITVVPPNKRLG
jgi:hypothetical protein